MEKDRPIDPTSGKKFARKRARTGFEPLGVADGRQPSLPQEYPRMPAFKPIPCVRPCEADAAAFRRARWERLFIQRRTIVTKIPIASKQNATKGKSQRWLMV